MAQSWQAFKQERMCMVVASHNLVLQTSDVLSHGDANSVVTVLLETNHATVITRRYL